MKIKLINDKWEKTETEDKEGIYIDQILFEKVMNVKKIISKGWDCICLVDGPRRGGKSTIATLMAYVYSNGKMSVNNYARGTEDASERIKELPDESPLIIDEGSLVLSSKDVLAKEQKKLMKIIDVCGQKNLFLIVVLPFIFELNFSIVSKARFFVHIYTDENLNRGRFGYWGEKKIAFLYSVGKKNYYSYSKPEADFIGKYTDFRPPFYKEYLELKKKSLIEALDIGKKKEEKLSWYQKHFRTGVYNIKKKHKFKHKELAELFECDERTICMSLANKKEMINEPRA